MMVVVTVEAWLAVEVGGVVGATAVGGGGGHYWYNIDNHNDNAKYNHKNSSSNRLTP
jgi:hypothetical protein